MTTIVDFLHELLISLSFIWIESLKLDDAFFFDNRSILIGPKYLLSKNEIFNLSFSSKVYLLFYLFVCSTSSQVVEGGYIVECKSLDFVASLLLVLLKFSHDLLYL